MTHNYNYKQVCIQYSLTSDAPSFRGTHLSNATYLTQSFFGSCMFTEVARLVPPDSLGPPLTLAQSGGRRPGRTRRIDAPRRPSRCRSSSPPGSPRRRRGG